LPADLLAQVEYLIPNEIEAAMLAGLSAASLDNDAAIEAAVATLRAAGSANILVTLGAKGVYAALTSGSVHFTAQPTKAVDTTAAGDTFIGGFVAALAEGRGEAEAIAFGQRAAALSVARIGAQTSIPYRRELEA
jgi:ribokinase